MNDRLRFQRGAAYQVVKKTPEAVWIVDLCGAPGYEARLSVTNDAEDVARRVAANYGAEKRIYYRDTMGNWDELCHKVGVFTRFMPGQDKAP